MNKFYANQHLTVLLDLWQIKSNISYRYLIHRNKIFE